MVWLKVIEWRQVLSRNALVTQRPLMKFHQADTGYHLSLRPPPFLTTTEVVRSGASGQWVHPRHRGHAVVAKLGGGHAPFKICRRIDRPAARLPRAALANNGGEQCHTYEAGGSSIFTLVLDFILRLHVDVENIALMEPPSGDVALCVLGFRQVAQPLFAPLCHGKSCDSF
eukprot:COSAG02_NODE_24156_length_696_cov_1.115578_1_plen_170_part_01